MCLTSNTRRIEFLPKARRVSTRNANEMFSLTDQPSSLINRLLFSSLLVSCIHIYYIKAVGFRETPWRVTSCKFHSVLAITRHIEILFVFFSLDVSLSLFAFFSSFFLPFYYCTMRNIKSSEDQWMSISIGGYFALKLSRRKALSFSVCILLRLCFPFTYRKFSWI